MSNRLEYLRTVKIAEVQSFINKHKKNSLVLVDKIKKAFWCRKLVFSGTLTSDSKIVLAMIFY